MSDTNGSQSHGRNRDYVVLEQAKAPVLVGELLGRAGVELAREQLEAVEALARQFGDLYVEVARYPSRNAAHALIQAGKQSYEAGVTPPLVAVSERMFKPRSVNVTLDPKVSLA